VYALALLLPPLPLLPLLLLLPPLLRHMRMCYNGQTCS
jgi:hypothetical protein